MKLLLRIQLKFGVVGRLMCLLVMLGWLVIRFHQIGLWLVLKYLMNDLCGMLVSRCIVMCGFLWWVISMLKFIVIVVIWCYLVGLFDYEESKL